MLIPPKIRKGNVRADKVILSKKKKKSQIRKKEKIIRPTSFNENIFCA